MASSATPLDGGLYDPSFEHDACGVGFVADLTGRVDHDIVARGLTVLRNLEHRLQLQRLRRTHIVPTDPDALRWLARAMGFRDVDRFNAERARHVREVRRLHEKLFYRPLLEAVARVPSEALRLTPDEAGRRLAASGGAWDDGYVSEYCPRLTAWTNSVTRCLRNGAAFWFDYGLPRPQYYLAERREGTLLCHFRQRAHDDPFLYPGLQDITAWVDFTLLAEASRAGGFELAGFATQAYFLAGLGVDEEMRNLAGSDDQRFARLANQARQLMLPGEMGERFKAMAWLRNMDLPLSGFGLQDLRHTLG